MIKSFDTVFCKYCEKRYFIVLYFKALFPEKASKALYTAFYGMKLREEYWAE